MKKKADEKSTEFEFCKICRINHNQGRRHNFFPRHTNTLSSLFTRFHQKLSNVKSSLKNPSFALSFPDRIWCIFCDSDIDESGSTILSGNAIKHLASEDHLKNLKHFLWKYGGGMNKVDSFRVTEAELAKWEKRCEVLKKDAPSGSGICHGSSNGHSNNIQTNYEIINSFNKNNIQFLESSLSNDVMPLQYATNENYQVYNSDISEVGQVSSFPYDVASQMPLAAEQGLETRTCQSARQPLAFSMTNFLANGLVKTGVCQKQSVASREPTTEVYQGLTRISSGSLEDSKGNIHSGALPPWLDGLGACNELEKSIGPGDGAQKNSKTTSKSNPKRVGAAWAEKRKLELEMEKRGEIVVNSSDANWLPNFGRVWHSGSRKESMKEFKKEKLNVSIAESKTEFEIKLHPYISKKMNNCGSSCIYLRQATVLGFPSKD
ncbi:TITAN-like protein isoform X2 [Spinacia oleracea]|uniref:TITAN-like protein isoform X2 n=1 Tax=Spinacia oleracea TaxID=3562 RepID=A0A9R0JUG9_SPIOL|nr:TITAN-like protein isoform X2 [Spinacia oleracea]